MGCHDPVIPILLYIYLGIMPNFFFLYKRTRGFRYFPLRKLPLFSPILTILINFSSILMKLWVLAPSQGVFDPYTLDFDQNRAPGVTFDPKIDFFDPPGQHFLQFLMVLQYTAPFFARPPKKSDKNRLFGQNLQKIPGPPRENRKTRKIERGFFDEKSPFFPKVYGKRGSADRFEGPGVKNDQKWVKMTKNDQK